MSRKLIVVLAMCLAAASAVAGPKKNPDTEKAIKSELNQKSFRAKIVIGSYIQCRGASRSDALKMVDTELSPDGSVRYFARANCFYPGGFILDSARYYVSYDPSATLGGLDAKIEPPSWVSVRGVDFKDDRVEVRVSLQNTDNAEGSGKIKFMLGAGYRSWAADDVLEAIARGLEIPRFENIVKLKSEYTNLSAKLLETQRQYDSPGDAATKLANAFVLKHALEDMRRNRAEYAKTGHSDPAAELYDSRIHALEGDITRLNEQAKTERVARIQSQLKQQAVEIGAAQAEIRRTAPANMAEWQQRSATLEHYSALLDQRQKLTDELAANAGAAPADELKQLSEGRAEMTATHAALDHSRQQLESNELDSQFAQLTRKRAQLLDAYSRAFATPKERSALQELVGVLNQMVSNRDRASKLGEKNADAQLARSRAELVKYKKK